MNQDRLFCAYWHRGKKTPQMQLFAGTGICQDYQKLLQELSETFDHQKDLPVFERVNLQRIKENIAEKLV